MSARSNQDGFTLVEVLVSLAIFSVAIIGLQRAATLAVRGTSQLQLRTHAGFVADNIVAINGLEPIRAVTVEGQAVSGGIRFVTETTTVETELPRFYEVSVTVRQEDSETIIASRRAFRRMPPVRSPRPAQDDAAGGPTEDGGR